MAKSRKRAYSRTASESRDPYAVQRRGQAAGAELAARVQRISDEWNRSIGVSVVKVMVVPEWRAR